LFCRTIRVSLERLLLDEGRIFQVRPIGQDHLRPEGRYCFTLETLLARGRRSRNEIT
jgi:hypothetical protein